MRYIWFALETLDRCEQLIQTHFDANDVILYRG